MQFDYDAAVSNRGNLARLKKLMRRAGDGGKLTIGFIGGSITQGSLATEPRLCYAYRVFDWWRKTFPRAEVSYLNAGIGATDSQFGCARADSDLLAGRPDFVIVEFSVNDADDEHFLETYEGLVRKIYSAEWEPAVLPVHNVCYDNGSNAQRIHGRVAEYYGLPALSMQSCIYPEITSGRLERRQITPDDLHPNDAGHELVASVITRFLERVREDAGTAADRSADIGKAQDRSADIEKTEGRFADAGAEESIPLRNPPLTDNAYERSLRYRNDNSRPVRKGFAVDTAVQEGITDIFKKGWTASKKGSSITFEVKGSCIAVQYRKTMQLPAPVAELILDGDESRPFRLDANFDETWGDKLALDTVLEHGEDREHAVEIRLTETHEDDRLPFYLVSVIAGTKAEEEPILLTPAFTHNIWGGSRLREEFGYPVEGLDIGECWGISAHPKGESIVRDGVYAGMKLSELWEIHPELFGNVCGDRFPLLVKLIDAKEDLSIQVHPDDAYALVHENGAMGKTECWYVLDCPENATLVIGHNARTGQELSDMIRQERWGELIREIPVKKGDFIQIEPGTVHSVKGGILLLEIQQNSDITYRVYDYDRLSDGKPRQLHIRQSLDVITVPAAPVEKSVKSAADLPENRLNELYHCEYYRVSKVKVKGEKCFAMDGPFSLAVVISGRGTANGRAVRKGDFLLFPTQTKEMKLSGEMELILSGPGEKR